MGAAFRSPPAPRSSPTWSGSWGCSRVRRSAPVTITPASLFDGVKMESLAQHRCGVPRSCSQDGYRRTKEEYESIIETGSDRRLCVRRFGASWRGWSSMSILIRASNDRLLTDRRDIQGVETSSTPTTGFFVDHINKLYELNEKAVSSDGSRCCSRVGEIATRIWCQRRAPLELIASCGWKTISRIR